MSSFSLIRHTHVLAAEPTFNSSGVVTFIITKIVPIILAIIGVFILSQSGKGQWSRALNTSGIALLGLVFLGGAGFLFAFGEGVARLVFGG